MIAQLFFGLLVEIQHLDREPQQFFSRGSEAQPFAEALEKLDAVGFFQFLDLRRDAGLRVSKFLGRPGKALAEGDLAKRVQVSEIHPFQLHQ